MAAKKKAPRATAEGIGEAMWLRVPVPPEVATAVRTHIDAIGELVTAGRGLLGLVLQGEGDARALVERCVATLGALDRDVAKVKRAARRRPRRRT